MIRSLKNVNEMNQTITEIKNKEAKYINGFESQYTSANVSNLYYYIN